MSCSNASVGTSPDRRCGPRLGAMVLALLGREGQRNCWTLGEAAGEGRPWGMQHLLSRAPWDTDAVAGELHDFVVDHLGATGGIL
jgi:hypothetical protein